MARNLVIILRNSSNSRIMDPCVQHGRLLALSRFETSRFSKLLDAPSYQVSNSFKKSLSVVINFQTINPWLRIASWGLVYEARRKKTIVWKSGNLRWYVAKKDSSTRSFEAGLMFNRSLEYFGFVSNVRDANSVFFIFFSLLSAPSSSTKFTTLHLTVWNTRGAIIIFEKYKTLYRSRKVERVSSSVRFLFVRFPRLEYSNQRTRGKTRNLVPIVVRCRTKCNRTNNSASFVAEKRTNDGVNSRAVWKFKSILKLYQRSRLGPSRPVIWPWQKYLE